MIAGRKKKTEQLIVQAKKKKKEENEKKYSKVIKEFLSEQKNMSFQIERINRGPSRLGEHQPTQL